MMRQLFKGLGLFVATACLVWVVVLWHWQSTRRDMSTEDIVAWLVVLPLVLFGFVLLVRWAWRGASARADQRAAQALTAAAAAPDAGAAEPAASTGDAARRATTQVLAAPLACAAGASARDLLQAIREGKPRPSLDPVLRRADGLPAITARVADVDEAELADALAPELAIVRTQRPEFAVREPDSRLLRALVLLRPVLAEAISALAPWAQRLGGVTEDTLNPAGGSGPAGADTLAQVAAHDARRRAPLQPEPAAVRVLVAWPEGTDDFGREVARRWLTQALRDLGQGCVAPERWRLHGQPLASGVELLLDADRVLQEQRRQGRDDLLLLIACHSDIDAATVLRLDDAQALFGAQVPRGRIPGEAAAALLLADAAWPADPLADKPASHLHRPAVAQRGKSIDASGRTSSDMLIQVTQQALAAANLAAAQVPALATDADQHTPRGPELFGATLAELPHLDAAQDLLLAGPVCGHLGPCAALVSVALAAQQAADSAQPCLALSVGDSVWRAALLVRPEPPPAAAAPAPESDSASPSTTPA
jgi:hypothetical protein